MPCKVELAFALARKGEKGCGRIGLGVSTVPLELEAALEMEFGLLCSGAGGKDMELFQALRDCQGARPHLTG